MATPPGRLAPGDTWGPPAAWVGNRCRLSVFPEHTNRGGHHDDEPPALVYRLNAGVLTVCPLELTVLFVLSSGIRFDGPLLPARIKPRALFLQGLNCLLGSTIVA